MSGKRSVVVILSGGMDSTVLLWHETNLGREVYTLTFDYGQRHRVEIERARDIAAVLDVPWEVVDVSGVGKHLRGSSQTDAEVAVPHGHYEDDTMRKTVVPNRNMIMLSVAAGYAAGRGIGRVAFAAHSGDHAIYPDCRPAFVEALRSAIQLATQWTPVTLDAPLIEFTKAEIAKYGHALGAPLGLTWSCYEGVEPAHCGRCGTCVERREAFERAGLRDPTEYRA